MAVWDDKDAFKFIVDTALSEAIRATVRSIIESHTGAGIDSDIKIMLREAAEKLVKTEEIKTLIREQLIYWIKKQ